MIVNERDIIQHVLVVGIIQVSTKRLLKVPSGRNGTSIKQERIRLTM